MIKRLAILVWAMLGAVPVAQAQTVVLELFTSQGCSTCPPADEVLARLAEREGIVALSLHVDYWDYLGWKDPFGQKLFTQRQKSYANAAGERSVYTPQLIVQGAHHLIGHRAAEIAQAIKDARAAQHLAEVTITQMQDMLDVDIRPTRPTPDLSFSAVIHVVTYDQEQVMSVARGENAGRELRNVNVATEWMQMGRWLGQQKQFQMPIPAAGKGVAVLVQDGRVGPMLGAAAFEF